MNKQKNEIEIQVREPYLKLTYIKLCKANLEKYRVKLREFGFFAFSPVKVVFYYSTGGLLNSLDPDASFDTLIDTFLHQSFRHAMSLIYGIYATNDSHCVP